MDPTDTAPTPPLLPPIPIRPDALPDYFGPPGFAWLVKGRLGGMPRPGLTRPLEQDLEGLQRIGASIVVSLTAEWSPPADLIEAHGIRCRHVPIADMQPPDIDVAKSLCGELADAIDRDHTIVFHCHGGKGRTGTLLAAQLVWAGMPPETAMRFTRQRNPAWIESAAQEAFLSQFSR